MLRILIATHNPGKRREYADLLAGLSAEFLTLDEVGIHEDVEETGETFEANARLKAEAYAAMTGLITLADDSGLEVDALGGAPGVYSARYAPGPDSERYNKLLRELAAIPDGPARAARFRCAIALAVPGQPLQVTHGRVEGQIGREPRGSFGFGYDPIFLVAGYDGYTLAELEPVVKNRISHRARALEAMRPLIDALLAAEG